MSLQIDSATTAERSMPRVPPLETGDRLTRAEFERRYDAMPNLNKAELIEGVVYMPSPVRFRRHGQPHADLIGWLVAYRVETPGVWVADNTSLRLDLDNEPQPDAALYIDAKLGGQTVVSDDDYLVGAPDLIAEVASSSVSHDLGDKMHAYRRNGVQEYLVWRVLDKAIDWFVLSQDEYKPLARDERGICRSKVFPGLWLDVNALLRGELAAVMAVLHQGMKTPEHSAFLKRLRSSQTPP